MVHLHGDTILALVLDKNVYPYFLKKLSIRNLDEFDASIAFDDNIMNNHEIYRINASSSEMYTIFGNHYKTFNNDFIAIAALKQPDPFTPAYRCVTDIVDEFKASFKNYLPQNFDYDSNIGSLSYVYEG